MARTPNSERRRLRALGLRVGGEPLPRARGINPRRKVEDLGDGPTEQSYRYERPSCKWGNS